MGKEFLANIGTANVAKDLDAIRASLGDDKLTYLGYSYGTRIGALYAEAYPDKVRLVYRNYPLPFHQNARPAAIASACANLQGKFWEYHEKVFAAPSLTADSLKAIAGEVGLDKGKFDACLDNNETASVVDKDVEDASAVGVRGTPAFFVNGRMLSGAQPFERFKAIIDEELSRSSGG